MKRIVAACLSFILAVAHAIGIPAHAEGIHVDVVTEDVWLDASLGQLYGELKIPVSDGKVPLVIMSHGFGGNHLGYMDYTAYFVNQGFATFSLDFCGGGFGIRSDGTTREMSVLTEADDLNRVIDHFADDDRFSAICLWGQSQGGFVSCYAAANRPEDIKALVMEYPAFVLQDDAKARALPDGSFPETSRVMTVTIGRRYSEDATSFDIYDVMTGYTGPVLILHGDRDSIVPLSYSERAVETLADAELIVMPEQNHGFTGASRRQAMEKEADFLTFWADVEGD